MQPDRPYARRTAVLDYCYSLLAGERRPANPIAQQKLYDFAVGEGTTFPGIDEVDTAAAALREDPEAGLSVDACRTKLGAHLTEDGLVEQFAELFGESPAGMSAEARDRVPVLACEGRVLAVRGLCISRDCLPQADTAVLAVRFQDR